MEMTLVESRRRIKLILKNDRANINIEKAKRANFLKKTELYTEKAINQKEFAFKPKKDDEDRMKKLQASVKLAETILNCQLCLVSNPYDVDTCKQERQKFLDMVLKILTKWNLTARWFLEPIWMPLYELRRLYIGSM